MSPLSGDQNARARQLSNLRRGGPSNAGSFRAEHPGPRLKHGAYMERHGPLVMSEASNRILAAIARDNAALVDEQGEPRSAFVPALQAAALAALQVESLRHWLLKHGDHDERGRYRVTEGQLLDQRIKAYAAALDRLGATPTAFARLGFDVARTQRERGDFALWNIEEAAGEAPDASAPARGDASAAHDVIEGEEASDA